MKSADAQSQTESCLQVPSDEASSLKGLTMALGIEPADPGKDCLEGCDIGGVTIVRLIAEGGMGRVYEGKQEKPLRRTVAVKVMRPGPTSPSLLKRFQYEAEVLARLQHHGIAHIYSVGEHRIGNAGVPYFVMEYIADAKTVTKYATDLNLPIRQRLELLRSVCDAVAHGHQKGVIHRDLKPSNILIDGWGQPKVIDFGIARAMDPNVTLTTMLTDFGQLVGTLPYMSPEQFGGDPHGIDIRTDVYALGVVLYQLVAGRLPFECRDQPFYRIARTVIEEEPPTLRSLVPQVHRDIELIAAKCLHKDREQRYGDARELRDDLGRFLAGEPIAAAAPSAWWTLRRFAHRHRAVTLAAAGVLVAFVIAFIGIVMFAIESRNQQHRTERVLALAIRMLPAAAFRPNAERGDGRVAPVDLLRHHRDEVEGELDDTARATLFHAIAEAFLGLGEHPEAATTARDAYALWNSIRGATAGETVASLGLLTTSLLCMENMQDALALTQTLVQACRTRYGNGDPRVVEALALHARAQRRDGNLPAALEIIQQAVAEARAASRQHHRSTLLAINNLGVACGQAGDLDQALGLHREAYDMSLSRYGPSDRDTLQFGHNLGICLLRVAARHAVRGDSASAQRDGDRGISMLEEVCRVQQIEIGIDHPDSIDTLHDLGSALWARRFRDRTLAILAPCQDILERQAANGHGKAARALELLREAVALSPIGENASPSEDDTRVGSRDDSGTGGGP